MLLEAGRAPHGARLTRLLQILVFFTPGVDGTHKVFGFI